MSSHKLKIAGSYFMKLTHRLGLSLFFIIFFSFSLFQVLNGKREDWPFSYFGMYSGRLYPTDIYRMDLDIILENNETLNIFNLPLNYYHMSDLLEKYQYVNSKNLPLQFKTEIDEILQKDIISQLDYLCHNCRDAKEIVLRRRYWKKFVPSQKPDDDIVLYRRSLTSN